MEYQQSTDYWTAPPPTDGPNSRQRMAQGLLPHSGRVAPLPPASYPSPAESSHELWDQQRTVYTADEWREWQQLQQQPPQSETMPCQWQEEPAQYAYDAAYEGLPLSTTSDAFFEIDPSLPLPSQEDLDRSNAALPLQYPPSSYYTNSTTVYSWEIAEPSPAPARVIDQVDLRFNESRPSLAVAGGVTGLVSRDEWLRLGGFDNVGKEVEVASREHQREPSYDLLPAQAPAESSSVDEGGWLPTPHSHYAFPSPQLPPPRSNLTVGAASTLPRRGGEVVSLYTLPPLPSLPRPPKRSTGAQKPFARAALPKDIPVSTSTARSTRARTRTAPSPSASSQASTSAPTAAPSLPHANTPTFTLTPLPALPSTLNVSRKSHARRSSLGHIPRPRNAFILFRQHAVSTQLIPKDLGITDHKNVSQVVGAVWRGLGEEERRVWERLAEQEKQEHRERWPDYVYKPKPKGVRKPVGTGKKALAKRAKREAEEGEEASSGDLTVGEEGDDEYLPEGSGSEARKRPATRSRTRSGESARSSFAEAKPFDVKKQRRMELVAQALLEGEEDAVIGDRVDAEMALEEPEEQVVVEPAPKSASRPRPSLQHHSTFATSHQPSPPLQRTLTRYSEPPMPQLDERSASSSTFTPLPSAPASTTSFHSSTRAPPAPFRQSRLAKRGSIGFGLPSPLLPPPASSSFDMQQRRPNPNIDSSHSLATSAPPSKSHFTSAQFVHPPDLFHFGGQDLFSAPASDLESLFGGKVPRGGAVGGVRGGRGGVGEEAES